MKKILTIAVVLALIVPMATCTQKTHFRFEKIRNAYFRENTKFFAMHNLLWVIDRDKLVCVDPENGEMKEYVDLPGYPTDYRLSFQKNISSINFLCVTQKGFLFNDYEISSDKPHITKRLSMDVLGLRFEDLNYFESKNDTRFLLSDSKKMTFSLYSNNRLASTLRLDFPARVKMFRFGFNTFIETLIVYDGNKLTYAGIDANDKISYPIKVFTPPDMEAAIGGMEYGEFRIKAVDFDKSFFVDYNNNFAVYDGESFKCIEPIKVGSIEEIKKDPILRHEVVKKYYPNIISHFENFITTEKGLFNLESDILVSDSKYIIIDKGHAGSFSFDGRCNIYDLHLGMLKLGTKTKVVCFKSLPSYSVSNKNDMVEYTFDYLPEGVSNLKIVDIRNDDNNTSKHQLRVYAFTAEGLYRSDIIAEYEVANP